MPPEEKELIRVPREDMELLDEAGFNRDALTELIHDFAVNIGQRKPKSTGLSESEVQILRDGGAKGLSGQDSFNLSAIELLSVFQLQRDFKNLCIASITAKDVAKQLSISPSRVRQLSSPANLGLSKFQGDSGERLYPTWQFDGNKIIPHLRALLQELPANIHPLALGRFIASKTPDLEARELDTDLSPLEWLVAGYPPEDVLALARDL
jgi:hypothetical protein